MTDPLSRFRRFLRELRRRNVYKVAVAYVAVAFVVLQGARLLVPALVLPEWFYRVVVALALLGFPLALVLAWAFEMTPEGVRRTEAPEEETAGGEVYQWVGLAVVVLLAGAVWYWTADGEDGATTRTTATTDTATRTASTIRDTAGPPRVAVLPFENIAEDTSDSGFTRGMYDEVRNQLSKVSGLAVLSRKTGSELAESEMTAAEIGREHDVQAILEGSVQRAEDRLRIRTNLIRAPDDEQLWSQTYERELSVQQIFDIQADIAEEVASALEAQLTGSEEARIEEPPTASLDAYDAYLRGRSHIETYWPSLEPKYIDRGMRHLHEALRRDSTLAEAHAKLAEGYTARFFATGGDQWLDSASAAVDRALTIDPDLTEAHNAQARIYWERDSLQAAEELYGHVLRREPSNDEAAHRLSDVLARNGRPVEAVRWAHRAVRVAPRDPWRLANMGFRLGLIGMIDAAEAWYRRAKDLGRDHATFLGALAQLQAQEDPERGLETVRAFVDRNPRDASGLSQAVGIALLADRPEEAKSFHQRAEKAERERLSEASSSPDEAFTLSPGDRIELGLIEIQLGNEDRGRSLLRAGVDSLRAIWSRDEITRFWGRTFWVAGSHAVLGDRKEALDLLKLSLDRNVPVFEAGGLVFGSLSNNPLYGDLRSDPGFQKIVREVEARREKIREEVRQLGIDLYPPGAEPDSVRRTVGASG